MLVRFSLFNSALGFLALFSCWYADTAQLLWHNDVSHVSVLIVAVYVGATLYIGLAGEKASRPTLAWIAEGLTSLGLIGTVIGMMLATHSGAQTDASFTGIMTLLVTTLTGMVSSLLLDLQVRFVLK